MKNVKGQVSHDGSLERWLQYLLADAVTLSALQMPTMTSLVASLPYGRYAATFRS